MTTLEKHVDELRVAIEGSGNLLCEGCGKPYTFGGIDDQQVSAKAMRNALCVVANCIPCNAIAFIVFGNPEVVSHLTIVQPDNNNKW